MAAFKELMARWSLVLVGVVLGGILSAVDLARGAELSRSLVTFAIVAGYALGISILRTRSETASALAGRPVDERWRAINLQAIASAGQIAAFVALGGFALTELAGRDGSEFAIVATVYGAGIDRVGSLVSVAPVTLIVSFPATLNLPPRAPVYF